MKHMNKISLLAVRPRRVAMVALPLLIVLTALQPIAAATKSSAGPATRSTRLQPQDQGRQADAPIVVETSSMAKPGGLDNERAATLTDLYKQMVAGAPFSDEEVKILNTFVGQGTTTELEADVVISRGLYAKYIAHAPLTNDQYRLLDDYTGWVSQRMHDVADVKRQIAADDAKAWADNPRAPSVAPSNDLCAGSEVIPAAGPFPYLTATTADITDATTTGDPNVPSCAFNGGPVSRSIWYVFTPSTTGTYTFSVCADAPTASTVDDTVLAVYTTAGGCAGPFTQIACDDDTCVTESLQSVASINLTSGTLYYIVVWKWDTPAPTAGNTAVQMRVTLTLPPTNDTCATATTLALNTPLSGSTALGTNDYQLTGSTCFTGVGQTASTAPDRDVVYKFTAPSAGTYSFRVTGGTTLNPVLYVATSCPVGAPPQTVTTCIAAANRNSSTSSAAEETACVSLTSGQMVFVFVDGNTAGAGGPFTIEANACTYETEANGTPATANAFTCGMEGSITPAAEADFFSLGTPASGSRVFAMADGIAGNSTDFDMRVTTTTDTLEYDDANNDVPFGSLAPNCSGTPLTGVASYIRMNHFSASTQSEPYRLYAVVQPAIASATAESEGNDTIATANGAANNYFSGALGTAGDVDFYTFPATAGDLIYIGLDTDPLRNNTPINGALQLQNSGGSPLVTVNDGGSTSNITSGAGSLTATNPSSPAEGLTYRVTTTGQYYIRVTGTAAGDYLLSITKNCALGGGGLPCTITCPANVTVPESTPGSGSATVNYSAPTTTGTCGTVTCAPASGSSFPVGTTTVNCGTTAGPSCSFTVTVTASCAITCPANITTSNDANQCGAVVSYPPPTATPGCGTVTCAPPSGSFFPKGTTTVTCTASAGPTCQFTVTVNDTQPPSITCPANITTGANTTQGTTVGALVGYAAPTVSDNCPGVGAPNCTPASGSFFPTGVTTVTCSVADAVGNSASCSFTVTVTSAFGACYVDDGTGNTLSIVTDPTNPLYGYWQFKVVAGNLTFSGVAESVNNVPGRSLIAYDHDSPTVRMDLTVYYASHTATATVKNLTTGITYTLRDRNILNDPPCN